MKEIDRAHEFLTAAMAAGADVVTVGQLRAAMAPADGSEQDRARAEHRASQLVSYLLDRGYAVLCDGASSTYLKNGSSMRLMGGLPSAARIRSGVRKMRGYRRARRGKTAWRRARETAPAEQPGRTDSAELMNRIRSLINDAAAAISEAKMLAAMLCSWNGTDQDPART